MTPEQEIELAEAEAEAAKAKARIPSQGEHAGKAQFSDEKPVPLNAGVSAVFQPKTPEGAALRGFGQGASLNLGDELNGLNEGMAAAYNRYPALKPIAAMANPVGFAGREGARLVAGLPQDDQESQAEKGMSFVDLAKARYIKGRDKSRSENAKAQDANPITYGGAQLAGGLAATAGVGPGELKPMQTVASRALAYTKPGAALGGAEGFGRSTAPDAAGIFGDTLEGAKGGAVMSGLMGPASELLGHRVIKPWADRKANELAVQSIVNQGNLGGAMKKLAKGDDELQSLGQGIRDLGVVKPFQTSADTYENLLKAKDFAGSQIGDATKKAQTFVESGQGIPFNRARNAEAANDALRDAATTESRLVDLPSIQKDLLPRLDTGGASRQTTFPDAWKNKSQLQNATKYGEHSPDATQLRNAGIAGATRDLYGQLEQNIGPDALEQLRDAAKRFGTASKIEGTLQDRVGREASRRKIGLLDNQLGQTMQAGMKDVPGIGPAVTGISALTRGRMDSTMYGAANALSKYRAGSSLPLPAKAAILKPEDEEAADALSRAP